MDSLEDGDAKTRAENVLSTVLASVETWADDLSEEVGVNSYRMAGGGKRWRYCTEHIWNAPQLAASLKGGTGKMANARKDTHTHTNNKHIQHIQSTRTCHKHSFQSRMSFRRYRNFISASFETQKW